MVWVLALLAVLVIAAIVANEIRLAPDQDDDYEVHLQEHYRRLQQERDAAPPSSPRKYDAA